MADPFTQVYRWILDQIRANSNVTAIVSTKNILDFTEGDGGRYDRLELSPGDFPAIRLVPLGGGINLHQTSTSSQIEQNYELQVATGTNELADINEHSYLYFPLKWELFKVFYQLDVVNAFSPDSGSDFALQQLDITDETMDIVQTTGHSGWFGVFSIRAVLYFERTALET